MQTSKNINEIAAALAKAQASMAKAAKDSTNPHFRSKYADLASITDACREALTANSIAVIQAPGTTDDGAVAMTTRLAHSSGQWFQTTMACKPGKADAQGMGSVVSYLRRYCLAAMAGVVADDDDGEAAVGRGDMHPAATPSPPQPRQPQNTRAKPSTAADTAQHLQAPPNGYGGDTPFDDGEADPVVEYVTAGGQKKRLPVSKAVSALEAAYDAIDKLDNDAFDELLNANAQWAREHAAATWKALSTAPRGDNAPA